MELTEIEEVAAPATTTALAPIERAALALKSTKTEQHLLELATKHASITLVKDKAGREQAHGAYIELMRARTAVDKASKEAREDATKFSKAVIAEAARLMAIVEPEEERLKGVRDAWDTEQERIKAEAAAKERARVLAITERIAAIKGYVELVASCRTSERMQELQDKLASLPMDGFEEFETEALAAQKMAGERVEAILNDKLAQEAEAARLKAEQEAEAARLKAEREELARQRAEAEAERVKLAEELAIQRAAAALAKSDAEAKVRADAEAVEAERAELAKLRAELEAKAKPVEQPEPMLTVAARMVDMVSGIGGSDETFDGPYFPAADVVFVHPDNVTHEELAKTLEIDPNVPLIVGEVGAVDAGITFVNDVPAAPVASAIVLAVAEFFDADNKTAARWITERAAEISTLKD